MEIEIKVSLGDGLKFEADLLILKHAQRLYGIDYQVVQRLSKFHKEIHNSLPPVGEYLMLPTYGSLGVNWVLLIGVEELWNFSYQNIREFAYSALEYIDKSAPDIEHICLTLHGAGYGLDESEAFESEIAGIIEAIAENRFPKSLKKITIIERKKDRAERLNNNLLALLPDSKIRIDSKGFSTSKSTKDRLRKAGYTSENKPLIFVAMPFDKQMYDVFHYGIQGAVNKAGFLCERTDEAYFTGDIMDRVKKRIRDAAFVVADLTMANPNVYLEVGYAWGCDKQTILIARESEKLMFDVRGQNCLKYSNIKQLEDRLSRELENLNSK